MALGQSQAMLHCVGQVVLYPTDMTLGKRIARARKKQRITQKQVAAAFRISEQAVSIWERDDRRPDIEKLPALARILKVPLDWLLEGPGDDPPEAGSLTERIEQLPAEHRHVIESLLDSLKNRRGRVA